MLAWAIAAGVRYMPVTLVLERALRAFEHREATSRAG
jgi:hypothetical protein